MASMFFPSVDSGSILVSFLNVSLTWQDSMVILAHCCTQDEMKHILRKAREHVDGLLATNSHN